MKKCLNHVPQQSWGVKARYIHKYLFYSYQKNWWNFLLMEPFFTSNTWRPCKKVKMSKLLPQEKRHTLTDLKNKTKKNEARKGKREKKMTYKYSNTFISFRSCSSCNPKHKHYERKEPKSTCLITSWLQVINRVFTMVKEQLSMVRKRCHI